MKKRRPVKTAIEVAAACKDSNERVRLKSHDATLTRGRVLTSESRRDERRMREAISSPQKKAEADTQIDFDEQTSDEIDLSQLLRNLSLTPDQRLQEHQNALDLVIELEKAGNKSREQSE